MAISWGSFEGGMRVGIEITWEAVSTGEASATATVKYYTDNDQTFSDSQTLTLSGAHSGSIGYTNNSSGSSGAVLRETRTHTYTYTSTQYGSSPGTRTFTVTASGLYTGGTPSKSLTTSIPARPYAAPNAPTNAAASRTSDTVSNITWTRNPTAQRPITSHWLYQSTAGGAFALITTSISGSATSVARATAPNTKYRFRIAADNSVGTSAYDETNDLWTSPAPPTNPSRADIVGPGQRIGWTNKGDGYTEFHTDIIAYKNGVLVGVIGTDVNQALGAARTFDHTAANPVAAYTAGDRWKYVLRHKTASGTQGVLYSTETDFTSESAGVTSAPSAPTNLSPDALLVIKTSQARDFTWQHNPTDSTAQTAFQIEWRVQGAGSWNTLAEVVSANSIWTAAANTFNDNSTIEWRVRTKGADAAASPYSAIASFKTVGDPNNLYANKRTIRRDLETGRDETAPLGALPPIGAIMQFAGSTAPPGWLLCNGASLLRSDYPDLFGVIGTTYGAVDGTHFNLPNVADRVPVGSSGSKALGTTGGADSVTLSAANLPPHAHTINHGHSMPMQYSTDVATTGSGVRIIRINGQGAGGSGGVDVTLTVPNFAGSSGNGPGTTTPIDIQPKYIAFNHIIKV